MDQQLPASGHGSDVNKRLDRVTLPWCPTLSTPRNNSNKDKRRLNPDVCDTRPTWAFSRRRKRRVSSACGWQHSSGSQLLSLTGGNSGTKASEHEQHAGRTVKETVPHGRDVTQQQQQTVTTHRPSDGDARRFSSVNFCSAKYTRVYELTQQGSALPSCLTDFLYFTS